MKIKQLLAIFLVALFSMSISYAAEYKIDPQQTASAPWAVNEQVKEGSESSINFADGLDGPMSFEERAFYRHFLGVVVQDGQSYYLVQDFYTLEDKSIPGPQYSSPYLLISQAAVTEDPFLSLDPIAFSSKKVHGTYKSWHPSGEKMEESTYENGQMQGLQTQWDQEGRKRGEMPIFNNLPHGQATGWYANGQKSMQSSYEHGQLAGLFTTWYENGQKKEEGNYLKDEKNGLWAQWHSNGAKKEEGHYKNDNKDGLWATWYASGKPETIGPFVAGAPHGKWQLWEEDGSEITAYYDHGIPLRMEGHNPDGLKMEVEVDQNMQPHGSVKMWHANGQLARQGQTNHGAQVGTWKSWNETGKLIKEQSWDAEGNLLKEQEF